jgi:tRNA (guanosine-2'-O-)-methyltransferase
MTWHYKQKLSDYLESFLTDNRKQLIEQNLLYRTRYLTIVLEDIYQTQNASAVIRSCDCFGIQDLHVIENKNQFELNPDVVRGASQWVDVKRYNLHGNNTVRALQSLKEQGYRIVATSPHQKGTLLSDFDLAAGKSAIVFGTERLGISKEVMDMADEFLMIPMYGFTESLNISVSAAIVLNNLTDKLHRSSIKWQLDEAEKIEIKLDWLRQSIRQVELIEKKFAESYESVSG